MVLLLLLLLVVLLLLCVAVGGVCCLLLVLLLLLLLLLLLVAVCRCCCCCLVLPLLVLLLHRGLAMPMAMAIVVAIVGSSVLFALAHHLSGEPIEGYAIVYRTLAGCIFATLLITRGFAVAAWTHASYDFYVLGL